jgi:MYXO-CTERM domain-containing protein
MAVKGHRGFPWGVLGLLGLVGLLGVRKVKA